MGIFFCIVSYRSKLHLYRVLSSPSLAFCLNKIFSIMNMIFPIPSHAINRFTVLYPRIWSAPAVPGLLSL